MDANSPDTHDDDTPPDAIEAVVGRALTLLMEHCDSVQIFVTKHMPGAEDDAGTLSYVKGSGNWFARYGQVKEWAVKQDRQSEREVDREGEEDAD